MAKVVTQLKPLLPKLPDGFHIGVNISARHINAPSFLGDCRVFGNGFQGKEVKLVLEVTEREPLIDNPTWWKILTGCITPVLSLRSMILVLAIQGCHALMPSPLIILK